MKININENYYVDFDGANWTPYKYSKGGVIIPVGKNKGKLSEAGWINSKKYFSSLPFALRWITQDSLQDERPEIDLEDFIEVYENKMESLIKACKGVSL
jgi:hypothetical protein